MNRDKQGTPTLPPSEKPDSLADSAKKNPSALGDPVSLKNESSNSSPTEHDKGASSNTLNPPQTNPSSGAGGKSSSTGPGAGSLTSQAPPGKSRGGKGLADEKSKDHETLSEKAMKNQASLGDPVSLKADSSSLNPTEEEKGAIGDGKKKESKL